MNIHHVLTSIHVPATLKGIDLFVIHVRERMYEGIERSLSFYRSIWIRLLSIVAIQKQPETKEHTHALVPNVLKQLFQIRCSSRWPKNTYLQLLLSFNSTSHPLYRLLKFELAAVVQVVCLTECFSSCAMTATLYYYTCMQWHFKLSLMRLLRLDSVCMCRTPAATAVQYCCIHVQYSMAGATGQVGQVSTWPLFWASYN